MKKTLLTIFVFALCLSLLAGCKTQTQNEEVTDVNTENTEITETETTEDVEVEVKTVNPLPETIDVNNLDNCTVAVSFEQGDAYVDDEGKMMLNAKVYTYELYDMVDIATLEVNDVIVRRGENVVVEALDRLETGLIRINGGEENGGFELISDNNTVYYEVGMSDIKAYNELGEVTLPVSTEFVYTDESDLDAEPTEYYAGDFLTEDAGIVYNFTPNNTSVVIENGTIVAMKKVYTP